uniref:Deoxynucleotidyltransferase terminal-interacting protein 1 n=1 Tax=Pundamilia nyererei TaxID=303518 RepID=A0A3B4FVU1_9CICH
MSWCALTCSHKPWNLMIKHRQIQRRGRRSHMMVSYTDPQVSMDLLRAVLQPSFNQDIMAVFSKYQKFFEKAAENVKENVGDDIQTDHLIKEACRNVLEHVRHSDSRASPVCFPQRQRVADDDCSQRGSPLHKKVTTPPTHTLTHDRRCDDVTVTLSVFQWDPSRLSDSSTFVLGSRANKALGMGGTRGRIYIKHADLFKYAADAKDKQWLAERHHMRATGGKMVRNYETRQLDCPDVRMDELKPFSVPQWMVEKMQRAMEAQRDADP